MNSFSFNPSENSFILDNYKQWLVQDLYSRSSLTNLDDHAFLQKLSIMEADSIRKDIGAHASVTYDGIHKVGSTIDSRLKTVTNLITSSLDDGFLLMNQRLLETNNNLDSIGKGVGFVNHTLKQNNILLSGIRKDIGVISSGVNALNNNVVAGFKTLNAHLSQVEGMIRYQLQLISGILEAILDELRIPESQRENRYHIEQGMRFFNKGIQTGNCLYFDDALDEFTIVTNNDRKNYFSWYYLGMIYLYSKNHLDIDTALSNFDKYLYYAEALPNKHNLFDEAWIMKGECYYLKGDNDQAYLCVEKIIPYHVKASLRGMKYLSASGDVEKKQRAVEVLKLLMEQNPLIIIQILEDYDLLCNDCIVQYIRDYKNNIQDSLIKLMTKVDESVSAIKTNIDDCCKTHNDRLLLLSKLDERFGTNKCANVIDAVIKTNIESYNTVYAEYEVIKERIVTEQGTKNIIDILKTRVDLESVFKTLQIIFNTWVRLNNNEKRDRVAEEKQWLSIVKYDEERERIREEQIKELRLSLKKIQNSNIRMSFELIDNKEFEKPFLMATRYLEIEDIQRCISEDDFDEFCYRHYYTSTCDVKNEREKRSLKRYACRQMRRWIRERNPYITFKRSIVMYVVRLLRDAIGVDFSLGTRNQHESSDDWVKYGLHEPYWKDWYLEDDDCWDSEYKILLFVIPK